MAARRCSICLYNYPLDDEFEICYCTNEGNTTDPVNNAKPAKLKVARSHHRHEKFERMYDERGEKPVDAAFEAHVQRVYPSDLEPDNINDLRKARVKQAPPPRRPR